MGCRACGSSGGGCQFLGTAATSQVVAEAFGLALPHSALAPSGEPSWIELAERSALALLRLRMLSIPLKDILTAKALENAMLVHAAFGGSTNLLLHIPAIAHAAGLTPPVVDDWIRVNRATPRLVDALPNGPRGHPTVQVYMAGGVPEVMLHLRVRSSLATSSCSSAMVRRAPGCRRRRRSRLLCAIYRGANRWHSSRTDGSRDSRVVRVSATWGRRRCPAVRSPGSATMISSRSSSIEILLRAR